MFSIQGRAQLSEHLSLGMNTYKDSAHPSSPDMWSCGLQHVLWDERTDSSQEPNLTMECFQEVLNTAANASYSIFLCQIITSNSKHLGHSQALSWNHCGLELLQPSQGEYSVLRNMNPGTIQLCTFSKSLPTKLSMIEKRRGKKNHKIGKICIIFKRWSLILKGAFNTS